MVIASYKKSEWVDILLKLQLFLARECKRYNSNWHCKNFMFQFLFEITGWIEFLHYERGLVLKQIHLKKKIKKLTKKHNTCTWVQVLQIMSKFGGFCVANDGRPSWINYRLMCQPRTKFKVAGTRDNSHL